MRIISFCFPFWKEGREISRTVKGDGGGEDEGKGNKIRDRWRTEKETTALWWHGKSWTWCVTIVTRGLSRFSQDGICPLVTMKIFRTHGACLSMDRSEYLSSSLSSKRLAETSSSCLDWKEHFTCENVKYCLSHTFPPGCPLCQICSQGALADF